MANFDTFGSGDLAIDGNLTVTADAYEWWSSNATATANLDTFGFGDVAIGGDVTITASGSNAAYVNADNIRTTGFDDDVFVSAVGSWAEVNVGDIRTMGS